MDLGLVGKTALVTGGSKGLGRAIASEFASEGVDLAIVSRTEKDLREAAREIGTKYERKVVPIAADLTRLEETQRVVEAAVAAFGRIDILVNNAGSIRPGSILTKSEQELQEDWSLKLFGFVRMTRAVLPLMIKQGGGRIVNIGGTLGREPAFYARNGTGWAQGMANAALMNLTKSMAAEGAPHNVLVNAVNPGMVRTPRTTRMLAQREQASGQRLQELLDERDKKLFLGRAGVPEDIAAMVVFLASKQASYITGAVMAVDGGNSQSY